MANRQKFVRVLTTPYLSSNPIKIAATGIAAISQVDSVNTQVIYRDGAIITFTHTSETGLETRFRDGLAEAIVQSLKTPWQSVDDVLYDPPLECTQVDVSKAGGIYADGTYPE